MKCHSTFYSDIIGWISRTTDSREEFVIPRDKTFTDISVIDLLVDRIEESFEICIGAEYAELIIDVIYEVTARSLESKIIQNRCLKSYFCYHSFCTGGVARDGGSEESNACLRFFSGCFEKS